MTGDQWTGLAAFVGSVGGFATAIGTLVIQLRTSKVNNSNAAKLDEQAAKIKEVHAATTAIAEQTGTHKTLDGG